MINERPYGHEISCDRPEPAQIKGCLTSNLQGTGLTNALRHTFLVVCQAYPDGYHPSEYIFQ